MVGQQPLELLILVRIQAGQPVDNAIFIFASSLVCADAKMH